MSRKFSPPPDFELDEEVRQWALKILPLDILEDELEKFKAYKFPVDRNNWNFAAKKWLQRAIDRYKATALPASEDGREQRMRNYGTPIGPGNVGGNPHGVTVPEHILTRRHDELIDAYERRISAVVTHLKYGKRTGGRV